MPAGTVRELDWQVSAVPSSSIDTRLPVTDMNPRRGKVGQAAGVVRVAVSEDDVGDLRWIEPQGLDLPDRGVLLPELEPGEIDQRLPEPFDRRTDVVESHPGVDQSQPVSSWRSRQWQPTFGFGRSMEVAAVEVVDQHRERFRVCGRETSV